VPKRIPIPIAYLAQRGEGLELLLLLGHITELDHGGLLVGDGHDWSPQLGSQLALLNGGLALADLLLVDGEQDQLAAVLLKPLDVALTRLQGFVLAPLVDRDADSLGEAGANAGTLWDTEIQRIRRSVIIESGMNSPSALPG